MILIALPGQSHCPPVTDGGFYYLRRSDGTILLQGDDYWKFESEEEARGFAEACLEEPVTIGYMPRLRAN